MASKEMINGMEFTFLTPKDTACSPERAETVCAALNHCFNDKGCASCPMYEECGGDAKLMMGLAADALAGIIHAGKAEGNEQILQL